MEQKRKPTGNRKTDQRASSGSGREKRQGWVKRFSRKHRFRPFAVRLAIIGILGLILAVLALGAGTVGFMSRSLTMKLEDMGELATQVGYCTQVKVYSDAQKIWGYEIPFTQSKYIFSYDVAVRAGLDFGEVELSVNDVSKVITVDLPQMRILSSDIDPDSLQVYDESRNIFTPLKMDRLNASLNELRSQARTAAIDNGILESARANAELLIANLLAGAYNLQEYQLEFK